MTLLTSITVGSRVQHDLMTGNSIIQGNGGQVVWSPEDMGATLKFLNETDSANLLIRTMEDVAEFDFDSDLSGEVEELGISAGAMAVGSHPILAVLWCIADIMFFQGSDYNHLLRELSKGIRLIAKQEIKSFAQRQHAGLLTGIREQLNHLKLDRRWWRNLLQLMTIWMPGVFSSSCWNFEDSNDCLVHRQTQGGAEGLIVEIEFVQIMIGMYLHTKSIANMEDDASNLLPFLRKGANLLYWHFNVWKAHRLDSSRFTYGSCDTSRDSSGDFFCRQGQDAYLHDTTLVGEANEDRDLKPPFGGRYSGTHCVGTFSGHRRRRHWHSGYYKKNQFGRRRAPQNKLNGWFNQCRTDWFNSVVEQVHWLRSVVNSVMRAIYRMASQKGEFYLAAHGSLSCNHVPYHHCEKAASNATNLLSPSIGFIVGTWSHVPIGCSVQSGGEWAVHWNKAVTWHGESNFYSRVCHA
jgi:hypothetical protein